MLLQLATSQTFMIQINENVDTDVSRASCCDAHDSSSKNIATAENSFSTKAIDDDTGFFVIVLKRRFTVE